MPAQSPSVHKAPTVLVGGMFLESHSFAPRPSLRENFVVMESEALLAKLQISESVLAGGVRALQSLGAELIPTFSAVAPPGGLADHAAYVEFRDRLVEAARRHRPDGVFLELHGAMGSTEIEDTEGDIATRLREVLGPDVPIAAGLDMHACITTAMMRATPLWVACKENPHTDYALAGARAAEILMRTLRGEIRPATYVTWLPLLLRGRLGTGAGPLALIHGFRRSHEAAPGIEDISIYNTYAFLDADEAGQCVTVTTAEPSDDAARVVLQLAHAIWERRDDFGVDRPSAEEVLAPLAAGQGPVILGDHGDRVLGGASGDGSYLLRHILEKRPDLRALIPMTDPEAVAMAARAGVGAVIETTLGGAITPDEIPVPGRWTVKHLGDGAFVQQGPFLANEPAEMGPTAVLAAGPVTLIVSSRPAFSQDPACFLSNGEDPALYDVVVCKSGFHFEPGFARYGRTVAVDTPGLTNYVPGHFKYVRRPVYWPEDPSVRPDFRVHAFAPQATGARAHVAS